MVWKQGTSGNPGGAATAKPFRDALRLELAAAGEDNKALRRVARALLVKAAGGDISAISLLADRIEGKVAQAIGGSDELGPQRLQITWKGAHTIHPIAGPASTGFTALAGQAHETQ